MDGNLTWRAAMELTDNIVRADTLPEFLALLDPLQRLDTSARLVTGSSSSQRVVPVLTPSPPPPLPPQPRRWIIPSDLRFPPLPLIEDRGVLQEVFLTLDIFPSKPGIPLIEESEESLFPTNGRLAYLGDSCLALTATVYLRSTYPRMYVSALSKVRMLLVRNAVFEHYARLYKLQDRVPSSPYRESAVLGSATLATLFEAYIGGVYLSYGMPVLQEFCNGLFFPHAQRIYQELTMTAEERELTVNVPELLRKAKQTQAVQSTVVPVTTAISVKGSRSVEGGSRASRISTKGRSAEKRSLQRRLRLERGEHERQAATEGLSNQLDEADSWESAEERYSDLEEVQDDFENTEESESAAFDSYDSDEQDPYEGVENTLAASTTASVGTVKSVAGSRKQVSKKDQTAPSDDSSAPEELYLQEGTAQRKLVTAYFQAFAEANQSIKWEYHQDNTKRHTAIAYHVKTVGEKGAPIAWGTHTDKSKAELVAMGNFFEGRAEMANSPFKMPDETLLASLETAGNGEGTRKKQGSKGSVRETLAASVAKAKSKADETDALTREEMESVATVIDILQSHAERDEASTIDVPTQNTIKPPSETETSTVEGLVEETGEPASETQTLAVEIGIDDAIEAPLEVEASVETVIDDAVETPSDNETSTVEAVIEETVDSISENQASAVDSVIEEAIEPISESQTSAVEAIADVAASQLPAVEAPVEETVAAASEKLAVDTESVSKDAVDPTPEKEASTADARINGFLASEGFNGGAGQPADVTSDDLKGLKDALRFRVRNAKPVPSKHPSKVDARTNATAELPSDTEASTQLDSEKSSEAPEQESSVGRPNGPPPTTNGHLVQPLPPHQSVRTFMYGHPMPLPRQQRPVPTPRTTVLVPKVPTPLQSTNWGILQRVGKMFKK